MTIDTDSYVECEFRQAHTLLEVVKNRLQGASEDACIEHVNVAFTFARPFLIWGRHLNPVHHTAQVLDALVEIMLAQMKDSSELRTTVDQLPIAIWAAVFHDAGNAFEPKEEKKIRVKDVRKDSSLLEPAKQQRRRHMENGARLVEAVMYGVASRLGIKEEHISTVSGLVRHHDDPTVAEYLKGGPDIAKHLFLPGAPESGALFPLSAFLREADRLCMLTTRGIVEDLKCNLASGKAWDPVGQIEGNVKRHGEERELYEEYLRTLAPMQRSKHNCGFEAESAFYRSEIGRRVRFQLFAMAGGPPGPSAP